MEGKGSFLILLIIVAFLSLTLAVLAGYVFFVGGNSNKPATEASNKDSKKPDEKELLTHALFEKKYLNLKNTDEKKMSVIQIGIKIKAYKGKEDKHPEEKLKAYEDEMKEAVIKYFKNMTLEEARQPETTEKAKEDLKKIFNEIVPEDEKEHKKVIYAVIFDDWFCQ